ncbi:MAG: DUF5722 domain-containing protein [Oscillospiraceae bacterium]|nr:DUF5722 domain-containing protein [Oscillospiraceae bacterium]
MKILNKKYMAIIIIITVLIGIFPQFTGVSAIPDDSGEAAQSDESGQSDQAGQPDEKTQIKSIIPYVEKKENEITQSVPVESREDMLLYPNVSLKIQVYISAEDAEKYSGDRIYIFKLKPYEEITDINKENSLYSVYFDVVQNSSEGFSYNVTLLSPDLPNLKSGEIFNKFVIAVKDGDKFIPIPGSDAKYISNINCLSNKKETPPVSKTKKGLSVQMPGEARMLGVGYTTVNMLLNDFMAAEEGSNTELYIYGNENYYFNRDKIAEYDKKIKYFTNEGINVTAVLLISARGFSPRNSQNNNDSEGENTEDSDISMSQLLVPVDPIEYLIHPNALASTDKTFYYGINTTDEKGVKYFEALMSFIADRYVKEDIGYGRIYNIILGSDIGRTTSYNYCGKIDIVSYVKDYLRALRICDSAIRSRFGGSRVYVPFDNWFAEIPQGDVDFINKDIIDLLCEYSQKEGNFIWNVAFKPYNADILNPEFWKETQPVNDSSTPIITMKNIEVLCSYLNLEKKSYLPSGEIRKVMLSDLGYSSGDNSKENMELQAAAFVYAYLKVKYIPEITAFIYHGHVDNNNEIGSLGLWTNAPDTVNDPGEKKKIYDVFKYMDTNRESEKIDFAKAVLGIEDFTEIAKLYSKDAEPAVILKEVAGETLKKSPNATNIGIFRDDRLSGFIGSPNLSKMNRVNKYDNKDSELFNGASMLFAGFSNPIKGDFGGIVKIYTPEDPVLNLSNEKYVGVKLRIDTSVQMPEDQMIQLILIMESEPAPQNPGTDNDTGATVTSSGTGQNSGNAANTAKTISIFEGLANISPNKDEIVYFDISSWEDKTDIKKIKLLVNPYVNYSVSDQTSQNLLAEPSEFSSGSDAADKYDFNLYVYSIISAHPSKTSVFKTVLIIILVLVLIIVAGYGVLYIRAQIIKKKRRRMRELQRRKAQAAAGRNHRTPGQYNNYRNNDNNKNNNSRRR